MMPRFTKVQTKVLVAQIHQLRHEWDTPGILAAVEACDGKGFPYGDTVKAAVNLAVNPEARTPGLLPLPGTHWQGTRSVAGRLAPVMCPDHPDHEAGGCPQCIDEAARDVDTRVAEVRAALRVAARLRPPIPPGGHPKTEDQLPREAVA